MNVKLVLVIALAFVLIIAVAITVVSWFHPTTTESATNEVQIISLHVQGYGECEFALWNKFGVSSDDNQLVFIGCSESVSQETMEDKLVILTKDVPHSGKCSFALWDQYPASSGDNQMVLIGCK